MHLEKNPQLSIQLTQPVIPLRSRLERTSRHHDGEMLPPAIVRGLLTLKLAKPTKVSSIELELQANATTYYYTQAAGRTRIDVTEQYKVHSASMVVFKAGPMSQPHQRAASARSRVQFLDVHSGSVPQLGARRRSGQWESPLDPQPLSRSTSPDSRFPRVRRRLDTDEVEPDGGSSPREDQRWTGSAPSAQTDQRPFLNVDFQGPSVAGRSGSVTSTGSGITRPQCSPDLFRTNLLTNFPNGSPVSSEYSARGRTLSRTSSIGEIPENEEESVDTHAHNIAYYGLSRIATSSSSRSAELDFRGRSNSRFSLRRIVHVVDAVKNRVRSRSRETGSQSPSEELERGRSLVKGKAAQVGSHGVKRAPSQFSVAEHLSADDQSGDGWVVFPEGTYTYPMFFTIPNDSPPTMRADHGSLIWKVKAEMKRPGTFTSKLTAQQEVVVICLPMDDETEDIEGIDLEKQWEDQFRYRVQIAGRGFPVGGKIPFQLTILPLAKIKVHSISIFLDERTEYYTKTQSRARLDTIRRSTILLIRHFGLVDRHTRPILPLTSEDADAFRKSPLYRFVNPGDDESEAASSFMGPGPWTICHELQVPDSCTVLHPSNQTKGSNIMVNHTLKATVRVEKDEESETNGRKQMYDIMIQIPILILSCHCTSEWTSLPCYNEALQSDGDSPEDTLTCPCRTRRKAKARTQSRGPESPSGTHLYEQLVSGLVSERGESPPSYERLESVRV